MEDIIKFNDYNLTIKKENDEFFVEISLMVETEEEIGKYEGTLKLPQLKPSRFNLLDDGWRQNLVDFNFGILVIIDGWKYTKIEGKVRNMTLSEIEEELGCKINLIEE